MHAEGNFKQPPEPPQPKAGPSCCLDLGPRHFDARDRRLCLHWEAEEGWGEGHDCDQPPLRRTPSACARAYVRAHCPERQRGKAKQRGNSVRQLTILLLTN